MAAAGKAESHILKVHRILSRALEIAIRRDRVGRNVAKPVDPPGAGDVEIEPLTQDEARRLLAATKGRRNGARWTVELVPVLRAHREVQDLERMVAGDTSSDEGRVFARPDGRPIGPRDDYDDWKNLLKAAGVRDARVHDGRHTAGTLL